MTNKLHNRTLFVAALSVYFGLIIVGAPPQVLAQTLKAQQVARCKQPTISNIDLQQINLVQPFVELTEDLQKLAQIKKYDPNAQTGFSYTITFEKPENDDITTKGVSGTSESWIDLAIEEAIEKVRTKTLSDLPDFSSDKGSNEQVKRQSFEFQIDANNFELTISFEKSSLENAQKALNDLRLAFFAIACAEKRVEVKSIYENTEVSVENNQVFIVTRLPRAALDSLLQANEKAN